MESELAAGRETVATGAGSVAEVATGTRVMVASVGGASVGVGIGFGVRGTVGTRDTENHFVELALAPASGKGNTGKDTGMVWGKGGS